MASPIEVARQRVITLEAELKQLHMFIQMYEAFSTGSEMVQEQNKDLPMPSVSLAAVHSKASALSDIKRRRRRSNGPTPKELVEMAERMIREAGRPLSRGELTEMFEVRDVELPATDKARYVGTIMWRNKGRFQNLEGRGYWLRGEHLPPPLPTSSREQDLARHSDILKLIYDFDTCMIVDDKPSISEAAYDKILEEKALIEDRHPDIF